MSLWVVTGAVGVFHFCGSLHWVRRSCEPLQGAVSDPLWIQVLFGARVCAVSVVFGLLTQVVEADILF